MGVLAGTHQRATVAQAGWHREHSANPVRAVSASPVVCTRRIRLRRHLVHHGRALVLVASVRVYDFVLFCILGFLACGRVGLDLLHPTHIVGIVVSSAGASGASKILSRLNNLLNFVVLLDCFLRCNFRRCLAFAFDF